MYPSCYSTVIYPSKFIFSWDTFQVLEPRYLLHKESFCNICYTSQQAPYLTSSVSVLSSSIEVLWDGQESFPNFHNIFIHSHSWASIICYQLRCITPTCIFFLPWHIFKYPHHQAAFTCGRWMHWEAEPCAGSYRHSTSSRMSWKQHSHVNTVLQPIYTWAVPLQLKSRNNWAEKEGTRLNGHGPTSLNFQASSDRL